MAAGVKVYSWGMSGPVASRPTIVREGDYVGQKYLATDEDKWYESDGDEWLEVNTPEGSQIALAQLPATLAGDGLSGSNGSALAVPVDGSSIETSGDALRVKAGGITRAMLTENALDIHEIPLSHFLGADGAPLAVSETAGDFFLNIGTNQMLIDGEATIDETEVSVGWFTFTLPPNYVAAGDVKVRLVAGLIDAGVNEIGTCTIDLEVYKQADAGTVGSDLCATAAQPIQSAGAAIAPAAIDFTVTATGLVAGDQFIVKVTSSVVETAGNGNAALNSRITKIQLLCDVK